MRFAAVASGFTVSGLAPLDKTRGRRRTLRWRINQPPNELRFEPIQPGSYLAKFRENISFGCLNLRRCLCDFLKLS